MWRIPPSILNIKIMSTKTVTRHNAKDAGRCPFCVGWGTRRVIARSACPSVILEQSRPEILMIFPSRSFASLEDDTMGGENDNGAAVGERLGAPFFCLRFFREEQAPPAVKFFIILLTVPTDNFKLSAISLCVYVLLFSAKRTNSSKVFLFISLQSFLS